MSCFAYLVSLTFILAVIRELRAILPAQQEHEGLPPIQVNVVAGGPIVPYRPDEERSRRS